MILTSIAPESLVVQSANAVWFYLAIAGLHVGRRQISDLVFPDEVIAKVFQVSCEIVRF
jgi:hypothetical protein